MKRRDIAGRRWRRALGAVCVMLVLVGCSPQPRHSPLDPGIPEARAAAADQLDAVIDRAVFSDRARRPALASTFRERYPNPRARFVDR